jgi:nicotinamidase-related amidase
MDVDPKRTALVLIEYQNDFTTEGGTLHDAVKGVMDETGMLENSRRLVDEARKAGATIIHAPISFAPGYGELGDPDKVYGILKGVIDSNSFVKGTWGVETEDPNVWICGAGARRGGGVSGIPGHNAARAVLAARR